MPDAPFWDRLAGLGAPVAVSGAAPPFHPLTLLARFLPEAWQTPAVSTAAAILVAALLFRFLDRRLFLPSRTAAAILVVVVFATIPGTPLLALGVISLMLAVEWFARDPSRLRWAALVGVGTVAFLGATAELAAMVIAAVIVAGIGGRRDIVAGTLTAALSSTLLAAPAILPRFGIFPHELPVVAQYRSYWPLVLFAAIPLAVILRRRYSGAGASRLAIAAALALLLFGMVTTSAGTTVLATTAAAIALATRTIPVATCIAAGAGAGAVVLSLLTAAEQRCAVRTELRDGALVRVLDTSTRSLHCGSRGLESLLARARAGDEWINDSVVLDIAGIDFIDDAPNPGRVPKVYLASRFRLPAGGPAEAETLSGESALVDHIPPKVVRLAAPRFDSLDAREELAGAGGMLEVEQHGAGVTRARVRSSGWNLLVTNEPSWSGWRAYWNGERLPPVIVNQAFVGSFVPPGDGRVTLRYRPEEFDIGLRVAVVGLFFTLFAIAVPFHRRIPSLAMTWPRWSPVARLPRFFRAIRPTPRQWAIAGIALLLAYLAVLALNFGAVAGGADSSGYLNFSRSLEWGKLSAPLQFAKESGLPPELAPAFVPLGFVLGVEPYTMVPSYPPGLPLMIAGTRAVAGDAAAFRIVAVFGALGVLLMYFLGRAFALPRGWSAAGAGMLAVFPTYVFMAIQPMTDSIAAALAIGAMLSALRSRAHAGWAIVAGMFIGAGVMVRPTQVLLFPALLLALRFRPRALLALGLGGLPFAIAQATISQALYGSPLSTGYGGIGYLITFPGFLVRFKHYSYWLAVLGTPLLYPGGLAVLFSRLADRLTRVILAVWFLCFFLFYTVYAPYETWWYTRFLLPALPALIIGTLLMLRELSLRATPHWRFAAPILAAVVIVSGVVQTIDREVFGFKEHEHGYIRSIRGAERHLPDDAMLMAMQMSGALRYYAGRPIVRWDSVTPETFEVIRDAAGSRPWYALLSNFEIEDAFRNAPGEWVEVERYGDVILFRLQE